MFPVWLFQCDCSSLIIPVERYGMVCRRDYSSLIVPVMLASVIVPFRLFPVERYGIACQRDCSSVIVPVERYGIACQCDCFQFDCLPVWLFASVIVSSVMFPVRLFASSIVCQFDCFGKPAPVFSNDCLFPVLCFCDACLFDCFQFDCFQFDCFR